MSALNLTLNRSSRQNSANPGNLGTLYHLKPLEFCDNDGETCVVAKCISCLLAPRKLHVVSGLCFSLTGFALGLKLQFYFHHYLRSIIWRECFLKISFLYCGNYSDWKVDFIFLLVGQGGGGKHEEELEHSGVSRPSDYGVGHLKMKKEHFQTL